MAGRGGAAAAAVLRLVLTLAALSLAGGESGGESGSDGGELGGRLAELETLVRSQQEALRRQDARLGGLELHEAAGPPRQLERQLSDAANTTLRPSIFGNSSGAHRSYTMEEQLSGALTHTWLLFCGLLVFLMQAGISMMQTGRCRAKSSQNIMFKHLLDLCLGTLGWWLLGWSIAFGRSIDKADLRVFGQEPNIQVGLPVKNHTYYIGGFAGTGFLTASADGREEPSEQIAQWFFHWSLCLVATSIANSGLSERANRANLVGYSCFTLLFSGFIYPVAVASTWGRGWIYDFTDVVLVDLGGSGTLHLLAGTCAATGAVCAGRRPGRFAQPQRFLPHSYAQVVLGTFLIWIGWYGVNCGLALSSPVASGDVLRSSFLAAQVAMNTSLAAVSGGLTALFLRLLPRVGARKVDLAAFCNGVIAGLVSISAGCGNVASGSAVAIGCAGGLLYHSSAALLRCLTVDDPTEAFAVHAACGVWGILAAALFDWGPGFDSFHGARNFDCERNASGDCMDKWGDGFISASLEACFMFQWGFVCSLIIFLPLRCITRRRGMSSGDSAASSEKGASPREEHEGSASPSSSPRGSPRGLPDVEGLQALGIRISPRKSGEASNAYHF